MIELIKEGFQLKTEIDKKTERLREINKQLAESADFCGKKSTKIAADGVIAKIAIKENVKWDQEKLEKASHHFTYWRDVFKNEFKPVSKKVLDMAMANDSSFADAINWARTISPGAPSVTYESTEEEETNAA